jgi:hypothetical protein
MLVASDGCGKPDQTHTRQVVKPCGCGNAVPFDRLDLLEYGFREAFGGGHGSLKDARSKWIYLPGAGII